MAGFASYARTIKTNTGRDVVPKVYRTTSPMELAREAPGQNNADVSASVARNAKTAQVGLERYAPSVAENLAGDVLRAAPKALGVIGKLAIPLTVAATAGGAAYQGFKKYKEGGSSGDIARAAFWGGLDSLSVGLANWAAGRGVDGTPIAPSFQAQSAPPRPGKDQSSARLPNAAARSFAVANTKFETAQRRQAQEKQAPENGANGNGRRGFQIPKVQAAAQQAQGHNYSGSEE